MKYAHMVSRWGVGLAAISILLGAMLLFAPTRTIAHAQATTGDTLSLAITNGSTFGYGGAPPAPDFLVTLTLPSKPTANYYMIAYVNIDSGESYSGTVSSVSRDQLTYLFDIPSRGSPITAGSRTATAKYTDPGTGQTVYSNSVSFTITKANPTLTCSMSLSGLVPPNQTLVFSMSFQNVPAPVDWQHSTYTIIFKGPITVTYSNLTPSSSDTVTVHAPSQIGRYNEPECQFNGSVNYSSTVANTAGQLITVSEMQKLGGVQLYSNPTTLVAGQSADILVKFNAATGLPTPTGYFGLTIGSYFTGELAISSDGSLLVHIVTVPPLAGVNQIGVGYQGDPYYNSAGVSFPLTNPPIPGNTQPTPTTVSGTPSPGASTTTTPTSTNTAATPTAVTSASNPTQASQGTGTGGQSGISWLLWAALAVIVILGGAGGLFALSRRAARTRQLAGELDESALPDTGAFSRSYPYPRQYSQQYPRQYPRQDSRQYPRSVSDWDE